MILGAAIRCASIVAVTATVGVLMAQEPSHVQVRILSPTPSDYATGRQRIRADVQPANAVRDVVVSVDGRVLCTLIHPPYECDWDAGGLVAQHHVRVVANLLEGGRAVATVRTKALDFAESVDVDVVQVTVTVRDGGHFVRDLPATGFHVFEDDKLQTITHFESEGVPLDLTVAIDLSSSMTPVLQELQSAVTTLLRAVPASDAVSLLAFNDGIFTLSRHASDSAAAIHAVENLTTWGHTALYDAILHGADLAAEQPGRKAMIVFTDGEDQGSHARLEDVQRRLESTDLTLYVIGQGRGTRMPSLQKIMTRLAESTGGRTLFTDRIDELQAAFAQLLDELSNQYLLGYVPSNQRHDGTLRRIRVEVDGHRHVRAREAYRAPAR